MTDKKTARDFYEEIKAAMVDNTDVVAFCDKQLAALDTRAAKAKEYAAKKKAAGDELAEVVKAAMSATEFEPIATIAARIEGPDVTIGKVQYRLTKLVESGVAERGEIVIPATEDTKKRTIKGFKLVG